jgi:hypothetical protein
MTEPELNRSIAETHNRWSVYFKERFPIMPNLLVALGIVLSAKYCAESVTRVEAAPLAVAIAVVGGMLFLAQIRFMDELKDVEKDRIAHPERPLPRGLFTEKEFSNFIFRFQIAMVLCAVVAAFVLNFMSGVWFAVGAAYLYLMYKEFFMGQRLQQYPMVYAITHQLIIFPMVAFVMACMSPPGEMEVWNTAPSFFLGLLLLGCFFAFEVARKLDPHAHPLLKTYLSVYGKGITMLILTTCLAIASIAGVQLYSASIVIPFSFFCITLCSFLWVAPGQYKWIEGAVSLFLLVCLWMIPVRVWIQGHGLGSIQ